MYHRTYILVHKYSLLIVEPALVCYIHFQIQQQNENEKNPPPSQLPSPATHPPAPAKPPSKRPTYPLLRIPTSHPNGFLKNPSLVSSLSCLSSNSYLLNTVATISANSISATLRPTHARGP